MTNLQGIKTTVWQDDITASNEIKLQLLDIDNEENHEEFLRIIDGNSISLAINLADKIQDEAHKFFLFRSTRVIRNKIKELNKKNVYSFVGYMITTSNTRSVLGDIKNHINYESLKHISLCFLKQAEDFGFKDSFQYKKLKKEYYLILNTGGKSLQRKASNKIIKETNMYLENLYMEMTKVLH